MKIQWYSLYDKWYIFSPIDFKWKASFERVRCNPCFMAEGILCRLKIGKLWHFGDFTKRFPIKMWGLVSWLKVDEIYKFTSFKCSQGNIYVQKLHFLNFSILLSFTKNVCDTWHFRAFRFRTVNWFATSFAV